MKWKGILGLICISLIIRIVVQSGVFKSSYFSRELTPEENNKISECTKMAEDWNQKYWLMPDIESQFEWVSITSKSVYSVEYESDLVVHKQEILSNPKEIARLQSELSSKATGKCRGVIFHIPLKYERKS